MKFYYSNLVGNQNETAKSDIVCVADITKIELDQQKKIYLFLRIDMHTNRIIPQTNSQKLITSTVIVKCFEKAIKKRFRILTKRKVILHTNRGSKFSNKSYNNFTERFKDIIKPSMSWQNTQQTMQLPNDS